MKTVLVVDDAQTIRTAVAWTLRGPDFRVVEAGSAAQAQSSLNRDHPDLVLVDVNLDGADGFAFCGEIKGRPGYAPIPVLLMSSSLASVDLARAESVQADGHLKKPFDTQTLIDLVRTHLRLPLTDDTPLTYAGRLARQRALEGGQVSLAQPPPVPVDAPPPPPPFSAPTAENAPLPIEEEPVELSASDVEFVAAEEITDEGVAGGPSLEPPPPPSEGTPPVNVDVWSLAEGEAPPPRMPPSAPPPPPPSEPPRPMQPLVEAVTHAAAPALTTHAPVPGLDRATLERIARETIEAVAWEVVPDLAETIIRQELTRLLKEQTKS